MKNPPIFHERAGTNTAVMHPRRLDFLREHVVICGAIAVGMVEGCMEPMYRFAFDRQDGPARLANRGGSGPPRRAGPWGGPRVPKPELQS